MQTVLHDPEKGQNGNCMQACVASLFELPLDAVPHFFDCDENTENSWGWVEYNTWFNERGIYPNRVPIVVSDSGEHPAWDFPHLAEGDSERGVRHCVIRKGFDIIHDPHPDGGVIVVDHITNLLICDPAKFKEHMQRMTHG